MENQIENSNYSCAQLIFELEKAIEDGSELKTSEKFGVRFLNSLFNTDDIKFSPPKSEYSINKKDIHYWRKQNADEEIAEYFDKKKQPATPSTKKTIIGFIFFYKQSKKITSLNTDGLVKLFTENDARIKQFQNFLYSKGFKMGNDPSPEEVINFIKAYLAELVKIIESKIDNVDYKITELSQLAELIPPSSDVCVPIVNRFRYDSNQVKFFGRKDEINVLEKMCGNQMPFLWIGISGRGGMGKSRLVYETCLRFEKYKENKESKWLVIRPSHSSFTIDSVIKKIQSSNQNVLICFDYVKFNTDKILDLIVWLIENPFEKRKIRMILIERDSSDFESFNCFDTEDYRFKEIPENIASSDGLSIEIKPFSESDKSNYYKMIISDYISKDKWHWPDSDEVVTIYEKFKELDPLLMRPLFALFTADAWASGHDLKQWDKESALRYFLNKEQQYIRRLLNIYFKENKLKAEKYYNAIIFIIGLATYFGGISLSEHSQFIEQETGIDINDEYLRRLLSESGYLSEKDKIIAVEPDLIGEFSLIELFDSITEKEINRFADYLINYDIKSYIDYTQKIVDDYEKIFFSKEWSNILSNISFPSNIHCIRHDLFKGCTFLKNIRLHGQIYEIEDKAFQNATNLEKIVIPSSVEEIGICAFRGCTALKEVINENGRCDSSSIIRINEMAFRECESLESIHLPSSVQHIGQAAFIRCKSLKKIQLPRKLKKIEPRCFFGCTSLKKCTIPDSIEYIGASAFNSSGLEMVELPLNLNHIGNACFMDCVSLKEVAARTASGMIIGADCFKNCSSLETIDLSNAVRIGNSSFYNCTNLKNIIIGNANKNIGDEVFMNCSSLENIDLSKTKITDIPENAFKNCTSLKNLDLPSKLIRIGNKALSNCIGLEELNIPDTLEEIEEGAFYNCTALEHTKLPRSLKHIRAKAFCSCSKIKAECFSQLDLNITTEICGFLLKAIDNNIIKIITADESAKKIVLPNTVKGLCDNVFSNFQALKTIVFSKSLNRIGESAFVNCINLRRVILNGSRISNIGKNAFAGCSALKEFVGKLYIKELKEGTFKNCSELVHLNTSQNITRIDENALLNCDNMIINSRNSISSRHIEKSVLYESLKRGILFVSDHNNKRIKTTDYPSKDGFVFKKITQKDLLFLDTYKTSEEVIIPENCIGIKENAFNGNRCIKKIKIPDWIKKLPSGVFANCKSLTEVRLNKYIKIIPSKGFQNCSSLVSVIFDNESANHIPCGTQLMPNAFEGCESLRNIKLPEDLKVISNSLFKECDSLETVVLPPDLEKIKPLAFFNCKEINTISFPDTLNYIGKRSFGSCIKLKTLDLKNTRIQRIDNEAFQRCTSLSDVKLPRNIESIGSFAFDGCHNLKEMDMCDTKINSIGIAAFHECSHLKTVILPPNLKNISNHCFKQCYNLENISLPDNITSIENSAFYNCISLKEIELSVSLKHFGTSAFSYSGLKSIYIPDSITELSNGLFEHCSNLTDIRMPQHIKKIPNDCFKDCGIKTIVLPSELEEIYVGAFKFCYNLEVISIPDSVYTIQSSAFHSCIKLQEIVLPEKIHDICTSSFEYCIALEKVKFSKINSVKRCAFKDCFSLNTINISGIEDIIDYSAFQNCSSLEKVVFSDTIRTISTAAFMSCDSIKEVKLPDSITKIHASSFRNNKSLKKVELPDVDELTLCKSAFRDCHSLEKVIVNSNIVIIFPKVFKNCSKLNYISLPDNSIIFENSFENCRAGKQYTDSDRIMPDSVKLIDATTNSASGAFYYSQELIKVFIGQSIEFIPKNAFNTQGEELEIIFREGVKKLPANSLTARSITSIILPESLTKISKNDISCCSGLKLVAIQSPNCEIEESETTIPSSAIICGYTGSTADKYAEKYGRNFKSFEEDNPIIAYATT